MLMLLNESTAARRRVPLFLADIGDGYTPETGVATPTIEVSKNGAAQAAGTGTFTEIGDGIYYYEFASGEVDTLGFLNLRIVKSAVSREFRTNVQIVAYNPYDTVRLGLTAVPNVALGADGCLLTYGTGARQITTGSGRAYSDIRAVVGEADIATKIFDFYKGLLGGVVSNDVAPAVGSVTADLVGLTTEFYPPTAALASAALLWLTGANQGMTSWIQTYTNNTTYATIAFADNLLGTPVVGDKFLIIGRR